MDLVLGGHRRTVRAVAGRHALRAAAVLPGLRPPRAAGQPDAAAERRRSTRRRRPSTRIEKVLEGRPGHRPLELLCRPGRGALLPAARCAARQRLLRAGRGGDQGLQASAQASQARLEKALSPRASRMSLVRVSPLELGPPVGWPLKFRVSGPDPVEGARTGAGVRPVLGTNRNVAQHQLRLERAGQGHPRRGRPGPRARARASARSSWPAPSTRSLSGTTITQVRDGIYLVDVVARAVPEERATLETLRNLTLEHPAGRNVPLAQVANALLRPGAAADLAPPAAADRDRAGRRRAGHRGGHGRQAAGSRRSRRSAASCRPATAWRSAAPSRTAPRRRRSIFAVFPLMLFLMATILMVQLMSFQRLVPGAADGAAGADRRGGGAARLSARRWASSPSSA